MEKYNVKFKKRFGQNFLKDINIVKKIIEVSGVDGDSLVIEVGPGGAIMTCELGKVAENVLAYEIDKDLEDDLLRKVGNYNNINVLFKDFLDVSLEDDIEGYNYKKLLFVSNVPYYITTPIILKILKSNVKFDNIVMMVQKELGERICSKPGSRNYGSITVLLNYYYNIKIEFQVSRNNFIPVPNVDSVVISFKEKENKFYVKDIDFFERIVRDSFQFKRKTIRNNLKKYDLEKILQVLKKYNYDLSVRSEMLSVDIFVDIANSLK